MNIECVLITVYYLFTKTKMLVSTLTAGEGVFTTKRFKCGDFLLEYRGDLIRNFGEALKREKEHAAADQGNFLYFFKYKNKNMW